MRIRWVGDDADAADLGDDADAADLGDDARERGDLNDEVVELVRTGELPQSLPSIRTLDEIVPMVE